VGVGRYFCYLAVATVYLHGVGPVGDLGVHGPVQRDKLLSVKPIHDNNDKAVIHQGSGPNLNGNKITKTTQRHILALLCTEHLHDSDKIVFVSNYEVRKHDQSAFQQMLQLAANLSNLLNLLAI
jgi:hypothetical protein